MPVVTRLQARKAALPIAGSSSGTSASTSSRSSLTTLPDSDELVEEEVRLYHHSADTGPDALLAWPTRSANDTSSLDSWSFVSRPSTSAAVALAHGNDDEIDTRRRLLSSSTHTGQTTDEPQSVSGSRPRPVLVQPTCEPLGDRFPYEVTIGLFAACMQATRLRKFRTRVLASAYEDNDVHEERFIDMLRSTGKKEIAEALNNEVDLMTILTGCEGWLSPFHPANDEERSVAEAFRAARERLDYCIEEARRGRDRLHALSGGAIIAAEKMMHQFLDSRQFWEHVYALNLADDLEELGLGIEPESPASSQLTGYLDRRGNEEGGDTSDQLSGQEAQQAQQSQVSDDLGDVLRPAILHPEDGQLLGDRFPAAACLALLRSNIQFDKLTRLKKDKASAEDRLREAERAVMTYLRSINKDGLATVIRMGYGVDATIRKNVPEAWDAPEVMEYYPAEQQALEMATAVRDAEARLKAFDFAAVATIGPMFKQWMQSQKMQDYEHDLHKRGELRLPHRVDIEVRRDNVDVLMTESAIEDPSNGLTEEEKAAYRLLARRNAASLQKAAAARALEEAEQALRNHHNLHIPRPLYDQSRLADDHRHFQEGRELTQKIREADEAYDNAVQAVAELQADNTVALSSGFPNYSDAHYLPEWNAEIQGSVNKTDRWAVEEWVSQVGEAAASNDTSETGRSERSTYVRNLLSIPIGESPLNRFEGRFKRKTDKYKQDRAELRRRTFNQGNDDGRSQPVPQSSSPGAVSVAPSTDVGVRSLSPGEMDEEGNMVSDQEYARRQGSFKRRRHGDTDEVDIDEPRSSEVASDDADAEEDTDDGERRSWKRVCLDKLNRIGNGLREQCCTVS